MLELDQWLSREVRRMMTPTLDSILHLSIAERIQLVEDIWDSIVAAPESLSITQAQAAELDRRLHEYRRYPEVSISWEEAKRNIRSQP